MSQVLLIRHARTRWNDERRIQGHTDIPLSAEGRAEIRGRRLPDAYRHWPAFVSPLSRAVETARLLGIEAPLPDVRLMEMHYGAWEGFTRAEIAARHGPTFGLSGPAGLDLRPEGGESPRELRRRLLSWLEEVRASRQPAVAVTHRGIIRMALSLATGWDLSSPAPARIEWCHAQLFSLPPRAGSVEVATLNVALAETAG